MPTSSSTRELRGQRVVLRPPVADDAETLRAIHSTPEVAAWWNLPPERFPFDADPETTYLTIWHEDAMAGFLQFSQEQEPDYRHAWIDLFVDPRRHRTGLGTDAMQTVIRHLVEDLGHHRILIDPAVDNEAAIGCYQKVGFRRVGRMRSAWRDRDGTWRDALLMELVVAPHG